MAIFHFQANAIQRSKGRSSVAAAAYRSGSLMIDDRTGTEFDYTRKGVRESFIVGWPPHLGRSDLWNRAESAERRKDSTTAREYVVALPRELNEDQQRDLVTELAIHINNELGVAVDVCIHDEDGSNPHAHILTTTRLVCPVTGEFGAKSKTDISRSERKKKGLIGNNKTDLDGFKKKWCKIVNSALELFGFESRIDHRSLVAQGLGHIEPQIKHYGNKERIAENNDIKMRNELREELLDLKHDLYIVEQEEQELIELSVIEQYNKELASNMRERDTYRVYDPEFNLDKTEPVLNESLIQMLEYYDVSTVADLSDVTGIDVEQLNGMGVVDPDREPEPVPAPVSLAPVPSRRSHDLGM
ncbi:MobA/MobL family protein [Vibrio cholerae]